MATANERYPAPGHGCVLRADWHHRYGTTLLPSGGQFSCVDRHYCVSQRSSVLVYTKTKMGFGGYTVGKSATVHLPMGCIHCAFVRPGIPPAHYTTSTGLYGVLGVYKYTSFSSGGAFVQRGDPTQRERFSRGADVVIQVSRRLRHGARFFSVFMRVLF